MEEMPEQVKLFFQDDEVEYTEKVMEAIESRFASIQEKLPQIDAMLNEKAEGWNVERMGKVELTVLRIAVYEMLYDDDVPETVAINEAIEISKKYGQAASGGFVNAVLAKFVKK
jgi:N utilization substance protein B